MDQRLSPPTSSPPAYGAVENQPSHPPPPGPPHAPNAAPPPPTSPPEYVSEGYPQPGQYPAGAVPNEPPPKYEPAKEMPHGAYGSPYPPAGYQPGYQAPYPAQQTVILGPDYSWSSVPTTTQCPRCRAMVTTGIEYKAGGLTWLASGLICLFGCWAGCCLIPFCMPELQDVEHTCPNCNFVVGVYHRM